MLILLPQTSQIERWGQVKTGKEGNGIKKKNLEGSILPFCFNRDGGCVGSHYYFSLIEDSQGFFLILLNI